MNLLCRMTCVVLYHLFMIISPYHITGLLLNLYITCCSKSLKSTNQLKITSSLNKQNWTKRTLTESVRSSITSITIIIYLCLTLYDKYSWQNTVCVLTNYDVMWVVLRVLSHVVLETGLRVVTTRSSYHNMLLSDPWSSQWLRADTRKSLLLSSAQCMITQRPCCDQY